MKRMYVVIILLAEHFLVTKLKVFFFFSVCRLVAFGKTWTGLLTFHMADGGYNFTRLPSCKEVTHQHFLTAKSVETSKNKVSSLIERRCQTHTKRQRHASYLIKS